MRHRGTLLRSLMTFAVTSAFALALAACGETDSMDSPVPDWYKPAGPTDVATGGDDTMSPAPDVVTGEDTHTATPDTVPPRDVPQPEDVPQGEDIPQGQDVPQGEDVPSTEDTGPPNTPPSIDPLPSVTLEMGESTTLELAAYLSDAEDPVSALTLSWSSDRVALQDTGGHTLYVVAPTDWHGTEPIEITVTDTRGGTDSATLTVVVEEGDDPVDPVDPVDPPCGEVTFSYAAPEGTQQVLLSGSFNDWGTDAGSADVMSDDDGDGVFEVTLQLENGRHEYKFVVDGNWILDPENPDTVPNEYGGNSLVVVNCGGTDPVDPTDPTDLPCGDILFSYPAGAGEHEVLLSGSFNGWASTADTAHVLTDADGDGDWEVVVSLDAGTYEYKFVVNGEWLTDPNNPDQVDSGVGGMNSVVRVPDCAAPGALVLVEHSVDSVAGSFTAVLEPEGDVPIDPALLNITLDWQPVDAASLDLAADGSRLTVSLTGLTAGIHDVRVEAGDDMMLLKVYVQESTDWRDVLLYFAMTDRFANGDQSNDAPIQDGVPWTLDYQGGDFAGVTQKIESGYFDDLGVNAVWISWPVDNPDYAEDGKRIDQDGCGINPNDAHYVDTRYTAYHGYWPSRMDQTESRFGTMQELRELVVAAHERGIRILLDFTANHVHASSEFYQQHQDDGFFNLPARVCQDVGWNNEPKTCWFTSYLPDLNYNHSGARAAIVDHALWWAKQTGADGFRFDAVKHLEMSFIQELRAATRRELELTGVDFYIVGETFDGDAGLIQSFIGPDKIHGQFDFPSNLQLLKGFARNEIGLGDMDWAIRGIRGVYGGGELMSTFIGNHDIARFLSHAAGSITCGVWDVVSNQAQAWRNAPGTPSDAAGYRKLRLAFTYLLTTPGVPLIYYGDEFGMPGAGDPDNRRFMRFGGDLNGNESETLGYLQRLGQARAAHPALRRGDWPDPIQSENDFLAYARQADGDTAVVIINRGWGERSGSLWAGGAADGTQLEDVVGGAGTVTVSGGQINYTVAGESAAVFVTR